MKTAATQTAALPAQVDVLVVGGGVSGLATAYFLRKRLGSNASVLVLEADPRPGGKVWTRTVAGLPVDVGPDAFLARAPQLRSLVADLGLAEQVTGPAASGAYVWSRGRLRRLPPGALFGIPDRIVPMLASGLLSPRGAARAAVDLVRPTTTPRCADPSVGDLLRPRFGREVFDRLVQPLVGGVHAGDADLLSASATVPEIAALARSGRSLFLTLRARRRAASAAARAEPGRPSPALVSLLGGMGGLVEALVAAVDADLRSGVRVEDVAASPEGLLVSTSAGHVSAHQVVLAAPAPAAADLLARHNVTASATLREIPYVDVANVTLAFRAADLSGVPMDGTGFMVPPVEGELLVGCSWLSSKWPHLVGKDVLLIRSMVGRAGDQRWTAFDDDELVLQVRESLSRLMGVSAAPVDVLVQRWPSAMPQYTVGHAERLARLDAALVSSPSLHVTGAAYRGAGLAGCVAQASIVASQVCERLAVPGLGAGDLVGPPEGALR